MSFHQRGGGRAGTSAAAASALFFICFCLLGMGLRGGGERLVLKGQSPAKGNEGISGKKISPGDETHGCGEIGGVYVLGVSNGGKEAMVSCHARRADAAKLQRKTHMLKSEHTKFCETFCFPDRVKEESCTSCHETPWHPRYIESREKTVHSHWGIRIPSASSIKVPRPSHVVAKVPRAREIPLPAPTVHRPGKEDGVPSKAEAPPLAYDEATLRKAMAFYAPSGTRQGHVVERAPVQSLAAAIGNGVSGDSRGVGARNVVEIMRRIDSSGRGWRVRRKKEEGEGEALEGAPGGGFEDDDVKQQVHEDGRRVDMGITPLERVGAGVEAAGGGLSAAVDGISGFFVSDRPTSAGHKLSHFTGHGPTA